jgi:transcriptional regulator with XRE-family HTH domain
VCTLTRAKVRALIDGRYLVHEGFAKAAGVSKFKLSTWLNGKGHYWYEDLWLVARELKVSMDYLCDDSQTGPPVSVGGTVEYDYWPALRAPGLDPGGTDSKGIDDAPSNAGVPDRRR